MRKGLSGLFADLLESVIILGPSVGKFLRNTLQLKSM